MEWNYAELSKKAKSMGGPEELINNLVQSGKDQMIPVVVVGSIVSVGIGVGITKLIDFCVNKVRKAKREELEARERLVNKISSVYSDDVRVTNEVQ